MRTRVCLGQISERCQGALVSLAQSLFACECEVLVMAPKTAQNRVAEMRQQGLPLNDARAQLKADGYAKSRVSQLLKDYATGSRTELLCAGSLRNSNELLFQCRF